MAEAEQPKFNINLRVSVVTTRVERHFERV